jgi:DNA-binding MarR family transcriptional regulator
MQFQTHEHHAHTAVGRSKQREGQRSSSMTLLSMRRRMLGYLACYPLLRTVDLAAALNRTPHPPLHTPPDSSNMARHLRALANVGLVEAVRHPAVKAALWRLTPHGMAVVAEMATSDAEGTTPWCTSRSQVDQLRSTRRMHQLARLVLVQAIALGFCIHAPDGFAAGDRGRRPGVAWHWMRDWQCRFGWRHRAVMARADAVLLWQRTPGQHAGAVELADAASQSGTHAVWQCSFVLVERAQETQRSIRRHVERLVHYRESSCRLSVYGEFPPVLIVVRHPHHRGWWREAVRSVAECERVSSLVGAIALLSEDQAGWGKWGDPWRLTWQSLADGSRIALADILLPIRRAAWPAGLADHLHAATALMQRLHTATPTPAGMLKQGRSSSMNRARIQHVPAKQDRPGPRHERILTLLAQHPLLTLAELAALLDLQASSADRYLRDLRRAGFIQVSALPGSSQVQDSESRWWLTAAGVKYTASVDGHAAIHRAVRAPSSSSSSSVKQHGSASTGAVTPALPVMPLHAEHLWGVYGFMAALHQAAPAHQARVLWWETGDACERSYPWHNAQRNLRPDAEFELALGGAGSVRHFRYWLEYDRGTMRRHDLCAKMGAYADYLRSREWMTSGSGMGGMAALPRVLFVVPDGEQERRVAAACASQLAGYPLRVLVTTAGHMAAASPYGPIWRQVYPLSRLNQGVQTRLTSWT